MANFQNFSDESVHAKITIPHWHYFLHEGDFFSMDEPITLGAEESQIYIIVAPSSPINIHFYYNLFVDAEIRTDFYEDTIATNLSGLKIAHNHNRNIPSGVDLKYMIVQLYLIMENCWKNLI